MLGVLVDWRAKGMGGAISVSNRCKGRYGRDKCFRVSFRLARHVVLGGRDTSSRATVVGRTSEGAGNQSGP